MTTKFHRAAVAGAVLALGAVGLSACGANDTDSGGDSASGGGTTIALLLPESKTTRYETFDKPLFEAKVAELCSDCTVDYYNADQDAAKQTEQVATALNAGADVLVLDPVNGPGATTMVDDARAEGVPVIAYDRLITNADYYMSFDNETVGKLQAQALVDDLGDTGNILMLNGSPDDPNAGQFKAGAHSVLDASGVTILEEYDNPDWSPENAQKWTSDQLSKIDPADIDGVYAANDGQAGGVVAALTGAGVSADALPPITGQDAEIAALQRIISGEQAMTIYKSIKLEAETAAEVAVALVKGEDVPATTETGVTQTEYEGLKSYIFDPVVVTVDNIADSVIADGFYSVDDICTADFAAACEAAGIS
ncbi:substrate-binding domain-containing protein [Nocardioides sp.]|uniref:substrate-binding domain-containing protein n=1 Tax=Nocardioides sp. TaxID=35761 RepID=UPI003515A083